MVSKSMTWGSALLIVTFLCGGAAVQAKVSPIEASIYITDGAGAIVFSIEITQAEELGEAVNGVFVHPFPNSDGNIALSHSPILLVEAGTPAGEVDTRIEDYVAVLPQSDGSGRLVFGATVGPGFIPASTIQPLLVTPDVNFGLGPVDVTDYVNSGGLPAGDKLYFQAFNAVPEPATWAMMGLGFVGMGFAAFRRRRLAHA